MSRALAVFHGQFGRATVYQLNRPFTLHAHREGHLIFHAGGTPGSVNVAGHRHLLDETGVVAVNPWEPHDFVPTDRGPGAIFFVLYVDAGWFAPGAADTVPLRFGATRFVRTPSLDRHVRRTAAMVCGSPSLKGLDAELRNLIDACYAESWCPPDDGAVRPPGATITDFRVRKSIRLLAEGVGAEIRLDRVAREAGLSRPHFYKLFRTQTGVTPNIYLNTLRMERALQAMVADDAPVSQIGFDLGFGSQSSFTRFFAANVGMAPTDYRKAAKVLRA